MNEQDNTPTADYSIDEGKPISLEQWSRTPEMALSLSPELIAETKTRIRAVLDFCTANNIPATMLITTDITAVGKGNTKYAHYRASNVASIPLGLVGPTLLKAMNPRDDIMDTVRAVASIMSAYKDRPDIGEPFRPYDAEDAIDVHEATMH